uniref:Chorismate lyase n=1 Tax=Dasyclonium flaccidum TaxID=2007274 RepID=A0A1Z1MKH7_9FLOR|nr:hypothetical protein [Dasyclonium flaccidum]ARW66573.1 hypothetical protein [Dasyclonium flaccidum]
MNLYIYTFYNFHAICIIPINKIEEKANKLIDFIPVKWQLILTNNGSFTQALTYLTNQIIDIKMLQNKHKTNKRHIRCVWLGAEIYTKLTFARSLWLLTLDNQTIKTDKPIGKSFIKHKIDIYKKIHEIYYGYSQNFEKSFSLNKPLWGRKYTLYYKNKSSVTIQEFFSPDILYFFYK